MQSDVQKASHHDATMSLFSSLSRSRRPMTAANIGPSKHDVRGSAAAHKSKRLVTVFQRYYEVLKKAIPPKAKQYAREFFRQKMHIPVAAFAAILIAVNIYVGVSTSISKHPEVWDLFSEKLGQFSWDVLSRL